MYDSTPEMVAKLKLILPTYYELFLDSKTKKPCITYQQCNDMQIDTGDGFGYSEQQYYIKLWGDKKSDLASYAKSIDSTMRAMGFKRNSFNELAVGSQICYIWLYQVLAKEDFNN